MSRSKAKGGMGEREVASILSSALDKNIQRNLAASRGEETADIIFNYNNTTWLIEVKRRERLSKPAWYKQALSHRAKLGYGIPILVYRKNREPWTAYWKTQKGLIVEMDLDCWIQHILKKIN